MILSKSPNPSVVVVLGLMAPLALGACSGGTDQPAEWRLRSFGRPAQAGETPLTFRTRRAMEQIVQAQLRQPILRRRWTVAWQRLPLVRRFQRNPVDLQDWSYGYLYQGLIAFAKRSGEAAPADLVAAIGRENGWEIGEAPWRSFDHPDDFAVGDAYVALEPIRPEKAMLDPLRRRVGRVIAAGQPTQPWWIDAIAMAPPAWVALACRDSEPALLRLAAVRSLETARFLYSPGERLFFRDQHARQRALEGKGPPLFWGRGNGWAVAGLARILEALPADDPSRQPLERHYSETLESLMGRRNRDGQLPSDLSDPAVGGETTATALLVFAGARGINAGFLDRGRWQEAILHSWDRLLARVRPSGELIDVQPMASGPGPTLPRSLSPFAAGLVLLAGEEVIRMFSPRLPPAETDSGCCSLRTGCTRQFSTLGRARLGPPQTPKAPWVVPFLLSAPVEHHRDGPSRPETGGGSWQDRG